jgi:hypothetical protein
MIKDLDDARGSAQLAGLVVMLNWVEGMKARLQAR